MIKLIKYLLLLSLFIVTSLVAQNDSTKTKFLNRINKDSIQITNQDQIYNRPFIGIGKSKTAVGGYLEGNTNYFAEDGVTEGYSMELRRFNIFLYSAISKRVKFLAELEFEHGTEEIELEMAQMDFEFNPALNFRAGILLPQIGLFNSNHDSPQWEIIERPLSSTQIIPSTLSEVGFGFFGKFYPGGSIITYNIYIVNGLQQNIIVNEEGKTFIPAGKDEEMFGEDNNGTPMYNGRLAFNNRKLGELGVSYYGGVYNSYRLEGEEVDDKRNLQIIAVDFTTKIYKATIQGEFVTASIDVPSDLEEVYGNQQMGYFAEIIYPIVKRKILGYKDAVINTTLRYEFVDYNIGTFASTGENIGDHIKGITVGLGFRPTAGTIIRFNYRYHRITDILGNPPAQLGGFQFGFATYF
ncbi:MAG: hypothetical protein JKX68_07545 [Flavobacteriales bacterium]|nr:hypothetical protein [Flavobacteriales bacterium]